MAKNEAELPSFEEIGQLPRWAIVAFAARCARRVLPLLEAARPDAPLERIADVRGVVEGVEAAAARAAVGNAFLGYHARKPQAAVAVADAVAATVATDAAHAAEAAVHAARAAAAAAGDAGAVGIRRAMRLDLERVADAAKEEGWTDSTPVAPKFFGPLWPEGEPPGWPLLPSRAAEKEAGTFYGLPPLTLCIDPGNASEETIQEVLEALSDLHIAAGGLGLEFVNDGQFVYVTEGVA